MARRSKFTSDTFLTVLGILAGVGAFVFDQWAAKSASVLLALALVVYAGRGHGSHPLLRYPAALIAIWVFAFFPWQGIWADFHKAYPGATWLDFANQPSFHWALAIAAALALLWDWLPFWRVRHRFRSAWRMLLAEEIWIGRDDALKVIRGSRWARLRAPSTNFLAQFTQIGGGGEDRDTVLFERYVELALEQFEASNPHGAREIEGRKEYGERLLRKALDNAIDADALKRFGDIQI